MKKFLLALASGMVLLACSDDDDSSSSGSSGAAGSLQVVMTFTTSGADSLVLRGSNAGETLHYAVSSPSGGSASADFDEVATGEWTLGAYLYLDGEVLEQSEGNSVTVEEGETAYQSIALELLESASGEITTEEAEGSSASEEGSSETEASSESAEESSSATTGASSSSAGSASSSSEEATASSSSEEVTYGSPRAPEAGDLVISEVYTHYSPSSDRFLEFYNTSSTDSLLLDDCVVRNPSTSSPNKTALDGIVIPPGGYYSMGGSTATDVDDTTLAGAVVPYNTDKAIIIVCSDATIDSVYFSYTGDASSCDAAYVPAVKDVSSHLVISDVANRLSYTAWCSGESTPGAAAPSDCAAFDCVEASSSSEEAESGDSEDSASSDSE